MPFPLIPFAAGAILGKGATRRAAKEQFQEEGKEQFQAVKGRKRKDGTTGKAFVRRKPRSR